LLTLGSVDVALKALAEPRRRDILRMIWMVELPSVAGTTISIAWLPPLEETTPVPTSAPKISDRE
jgi:hypothetical protein